LLGGGWSQYKGKHFGEVIWAEYLPPGQPNDFRYYDNDAVKQDGNVFLKVEATPVPDLTAFVDLQIRSIQYDFLGFDNALNNISQTDRLAFLILKSA
jgi:iron complex outermembrane receptor protein